MTGYRTARRLLGADPQLPGRRILVLGLAQAVATQQEDFGVLHEPVAMAVAMVVLKRMFPQSEKAVFNAESIFMRTPRLMEGARRHFAVFLLRILGAAFNISISLSVALKRPVRSFGAITDSRASSFTDGSARV